MKKALRVAAVSVFALFFGFPLYWVVTMAFKPKVEENPPGIVVWHPESPTLKNLKDVLGINDAADSIFASKDYSALTPLKNSFLAAGGGTLLALLVGSSPPTASRASAPEARNCRSRYCSCGCSRRRRS